MNPRKLTDHVQILNAAPTTEHGGQLVRDWSSAQPSAPVPALVQFIDSDTRDDQRTTDDVTWRLVCLGVDVNGDGVDLNENSRIRWSNVTDDLEVAGAVGVLTRLGRVDHYETTLRGAGTPHRGW